VALVRKEFAGSASHGYVWPADGAVIEVAELHVAGLLRIPDGGFAVVEAPDPPPMSASKRRPASKRLGNGQRAGGDP
jgi:hypothetical protein